MSNAKKIPKSSPRGIQSLIPRGKNDKTKKFDISINHIEKARVLYQKALEEFKKARDKKDGTVLRDACVKGWLSTLEATYALLVKSGVKEKELPKTDRGKRFMVNKYAEKELRYIYFSLRDNFHIVGYYDGTLEFDEMKTYLDDLKSYIQKIEKKIEK